MSRLVWEACRYSITTRRVSTQGGIAVEQAITWNAFPKEMIRRYGRDRSLKLF
jgi:hypothetical protein